MSNADNKTHGGKGVNVPTARADKNYRDNFDAIFKNRTTHADTNALDAVERCEKTSDMFTDDN